MIHLEGMGFLGCLTAWRLDKDGVPFTWSDDDSHSAWRASTGSIFPMDDEESEKAMRLWGEYRTQLESDQPGVEFQDATWWYNTKSHPFGLDGGHETQVMGVRTRGVKTLHINVAGFVETVRGAFRHLKDEPEEGDTIVESNGFNSRMVSYDWGWAARVLLDIEPLVGRRNNSSFMFYKNRFQRWYAYPVPGTDQHFIGSSHIKQKNPGTRPTDDLVQQCRAAIAGLSGGAVRVGRVDEVRQGWRPHPQKGENHEPVWLNGKLAYPPMGANGIRLAPIVVEKAMGMMKK